MTVVLDGEDEREVLWAAMAAIAATGPFTAEAAYAVDDGPARRRPPRQVEDPRRRRAGEYRGAGTGGGPHPRSPT